MTRYVDDEFLQPRGYTVPTEPTKPQWLKPIDCLLWTAALVIYPTSAALVLLGQSRAAGAVLVTTSVVLGIAFVQRRWWKL